MQKLFLSSIRFVIVFLPAKRWSAKKMVRKQNFVYVIVLWTQRVPQIFPEEFTIDRINIRGW